MFQGEKIRNKVFFIKMLSLGVSGGVNLELATLFAGDAGHPCEGGGGGGGEAVGGAGPATGEYSFGGFTEFLFRDFFLL